MPEQESSTPKSRRRRHRGPGVLTHLVGIFGGGALGLALGYWLLNYIGGPRFNFLNVSLPYIEHTQPGWGDTSKKSPQVARLPEKEPLRSPISSDDGSDSGPAVKPSTDFGLKESAPARLAAGVVRDRLAYTPEALGEALAAVGCEKCNSQGTITRVVVTGRRFINGKAIETKREERVTCDVCDGEPYGGELTAEVFSRLCQLGDVIALVEKSDEVRRREEAVGKILFRAAGGRNQLYALGRLASQRLAESSREGHGIALAGRFLDSRQEGELFVYRLRLFDTGEVVEVASNQRIAGLSTEDRMIVIGTLVENPQENLGGYEGSLGEVVLVGYYYRLGPEA